MQAMWTKIAVQAQFHISCSEMCQNANQENYIFSIAAKLLHTLV